MSMVYFHSGAKDLLQSSFLLHQYTDSSISGGLWNSPEKNSVEWCRGVLSWLSELPVFQHSAGLPMLDSVIGKRRNLKVTNLENMALAVMQWVDVLKKVLWWIMPYAAVHCHVELTGSLLPTTRGDDIECCHINVAVHLFRHLGLQCNPVEQIPCALHLCSWKKQSMLFLYLKAGHEVSLCPSLLRFNFLFACHTVGAMFYLQWWWKSRMCYPCLQFPKVQHILQNSPFALELSCVVQVWHSVLSCRSPHKILWQAVLLMFTSSNKIWTVIWFCFKRS